MNSIAVSPAPGDEGNILVATPSGIYRSKDKGASWEQVYGGAGTMVVGLSSDFERDSTVHAGVASQA